MTLLLTDKLLSRGNYQEQKETLCNGKNKLIHQEDFNDPKHVDLNEKATKY